MGLDGVELLLATKEKFQITISDDEAVKFEKPGMLADIMDRKPQGYAKKGVLKNGNQRSNSFNISDI